MRSTIINAKKIVVKVGSSTLCYANGHLNLERIERLVRQLSDLANQGKEVILVSSGATGAGLAPLGFKEKPRDLVLKQAAAAVGQGILIHMYERMFREYGRTVGQILLTKEDSTGRHSYLNLRNTLHTLLQLNVIPIINENDVVAIEEFKIGDNDTSNRAGFAVTYNENKNRWDIDNYHHDRLLVMYVPLTGKLYIFPLRLIAMIINKKVYDLPFKQSYYDDDKIFKHYNFNGKDVFYIDCDCIQDCMPTFMKKYCDNKNIRDLLANGNVAEVDKEEYSAYMENIKNSKLQ